MNKITKGQLLILSLILIGFFAQALFTFNSTNQIRYEELSESVRNVYWYANHLVFSGINAHLGWYFTLNTIYQTFGFKFETVQYFRLALHLVSIICLILFLKKYFRLTSLIIPLLAILLSPTLLYFNSLKTHFGIDLTYLPICLFLLDRVNFSKKNLATYLNTSLFWILAMLAWSSYPSFIYFLPSLTILFLYKLLHQKEFSKPDLLKIGAISLTSFLLPILLLSLPIENKELLLHDPISGGGLFQGSGQFNLGSLSEITARVIETFKAFLGMAPSLLYELSEPDFSHLWPFISIAVSIIGVSWLALVKKQFRLLYFSIWLVFLINLLVIALAIDDAGPASARRATGWLVSFYACYFLLWLQIPSLKFKSKVWELILIFLLLLLPLHHIIFFPKNLIHLKDFSVDREDIWFGQAENPDAALGQYLTKITQQDLKLVGVYPNNSDFGLIYSWVYGAVKGTCYWNKLDCKNLLGLDRSSGKFVILDLQNVNYLHHN